MSVLNNIATETLRRKIDENLRKLADLQPVVDRCNNCGLNIGQQEADRQFLIEQLEKIKREFFTPGGHVKNPG